MTYHVQFLLLVLAGWVNRQQQDVIDYQQEENRVLRAGLRGKRLRLSDDDRRRLAIKAQALGREVLAQIASVATPATLLRWYRCLIVVKYDGSKNRSPGRPPTAKDIRELIVRVAQENPTWGYTRLRGARTVCSAPGFGASVSVSRTTSGAGSRSRPRLWAARRWPRLRPLPHPLRFCAGTATSSQPSTMAARTGVQADLRRRRTSVSSLCAWRGRTRRGDIRACEAHSRT